MRVIASIDQSQHSRDAVDFLRHLPCRETIELSLVTIATPLPRYDVTAAGFAIDVTELVEAQKNSIETSLQKLAADLQGDFDSVVTMMGNGSPGRELVRMAGAHQTDLILMGAIGHSAIARVLLGSTSDYVATHAPCSTMIVRRPIGEAPEPNAVTSTPKRVLVGIGNATSDGDLGKWIETLQLPKTTDVHLVHVIEAVQFYEFDLLRKASAYWKDVRSTAAAHLDKLSSQLTDSGYSVTSRILDAPHTGRALVEYAQKKRCDLIMTGDQSESLAERITMGSVSRHVLRHAKCSVLISRIDRDE